MKKILLALALVAGFAQMAQAEGIDSEKVKAALEAQSSCQNLVRYDDQFVYLGYGAYLLGAESPRSPIPAVLSVVSLDAPTKPMHLATLDGVVDVIRIENRLFALTYSGLEEFDLSNMTRVANYATTNLTRKLMYREHATGMILHDGKFYISHGRLGVTVFDIATHQVIAEKALVQKQAPLVSQAVGIAAHGDHAVVLMDDYTLIRPGDKPAFRGFVVIDMNSMQVVSEVNGMETGPEALNVVGDHAIVSFGHMISSFSIEQLVTKSRLQLDTHTQIRFPDRGHPTGRPSYDSKYLYTCFSTPPPMGQGGLFTRAPRALGL